MPGQKPRQSLSFLVEVQAQLMNVTCADLTVFVVDDPQTTTTDDHIYSIMTVTVPLSHLSSTKPTAAESSSRKTLHGLALAVAKAKRIVVVTGAGISCSSGIPDFRSSDGLYNLVKSRYPDVVMKGRDLFDAALFRDPMSSALFYTFMAELKTQIDGAHPAPVHDFLATLDAKGKLLRSYTQNIDGLEERAGLSTQEPNVGNSTAPRAKNVQLHGDIHRVRCTLCSASYPCDPEHIAQFRTGVPPDCPECIARSDARTARAARALKCGTLRPAIVLYDEPHPLGDHIGAVQTADLGKKPDLLIVMGTSLKVHGLRSLVKSFAKAVHSSRTDTSRAFLHNVVFVNRTPPPPGEWAGILDYHVQGDADAWVGHVLGEWRKARPVDWEVQSTLDGIPRPLGKAGSSKEGKGKDKEVTGAKSSAGKTGKKGKSKTAESENTPPEETARFKIVLPAGKRKMRIGLSKSPARSMGRPVGGVGKSGVGRSVGLSKSPFLTPGKKPGIRLGLKRPAASPLTPRVQRQPRIDAVFTKSPRFPITREGSSASTPYPSTSASAHSSQLELVTSQTSSSQLELSTSAQSSQAPSSQTSRSSTQDSIFSSQDSQSTAASSLADLGEMECGASQSTVGPSSQNTVGPRSVESRPAPDTQDTIMASPPRSNSLPIKSPKRYLGAARLPPSRCQSLGSGKLFANPPSFGQGSPWSSQIAGTSSQPAQSTSSQPVPIRVSSATGRPFTRNASTSQLHRRATHIPIPGRDFVVSSTGERINCTDTDSEEDIPLASQVSVTAPPRPSQSFMASGSRSVLGKTMVVEIPAYRDSASPDKGKAMDEDSDSDEDLADAEPPRGLLFKTRDEDVIDVDPTTEESDGMSLDGAVEHMSLSRGDDTDVDVTGTDSGRERLMISPIKTRARRTKEAVAKRVAKKAPRARVAGVRSSQRLAVKASS